MKALFSTAYLGSIAYYADILSMEEISLERCESWQKQTYRNRCYIDSPNAKLMLNIPVKHNKKGISEIEISYDEAWVNKHWQAIQTAYGTAPFFEVLAPDIKQILERKYQRLYDLNLSLMHFVLDTLNSTTPIKETSDWQTEYEDRMDFRNKHHPKKESVKNLEPYPQMFEHKHGFLPNLSIIDLLFNEGPASYGYLISINN